jgi:hypothetical protein
MTGRPTCGHPKADGSPCPVSFGLCPACSECYHHCSHRAEERKAARAKGGNVAKARGLAKTERDKYRVPAGEIPPPPTDVAGARDYLAWLLDAGTSGAMGSARAKDMAQVARWLIDATKVASLEVRLKGLEQALKEAGQ